MAEPDAAAGRRRALLVATGAYGDPGLAKLRAPTGDVDTLATVLEDGTIGEFEVSRLVDRPTEDLKKEIEAFCDEARPDDLLLLYFSCHGILSQTRQFYFATTTTALNLLRATAIEDSFVNDVVQHSRARSIVLILDCCHSGAFGTGLTPKSPPTVDVEHRFEGLGRVTLSASTALEYAFEAADPAHGMNELEPAAPGSLFTRCLVEGLSTGEADVNGDGSISVEELYGYVRRRMRDSGAHQTPGIAGDVRSEIVIARTHRVKARARGLSSRVRGVLRQSRPEPPTVVLPPPPGPPTEVPPPAPVPTVPPARRFPRPRRGGVLAAAGALVAGGIAVWLLAGGSADPATPYDFDGDGAQEIVIAPVSAGTGTVLIHRGAGDEPPLSISAAAADVEEAATKEFGTGIASADFNGDGHADLALGTPLVNAVSVLYGGSEGMADARPERIDRNEAAVPSGKYGANLVARDLNGDGFDDLVVSAPGSGDERGALQILFGSDSGLHTGDPRMLEPPPEDVDHFGSRLRSGDINGDEHPDIVEGAIDPLEGDPTGHLGYCLGSADGPTSCELLAGRGEYGGTSALAVADVNDDDRDDIIQADTRLPEGVGGVRLWLGSGDGPADRPTTVKTADDLGLSAGGGPDDDFGGVMDAGRLEGDEYADVVVGSPGIDGDTGAVAIIRGAKGGFGSARLVPWEDASAGVRFGAAVALLRLGGADSALELVVGAENASADEAVLVGRGGFQTLAGLGDAMEGGSAENLKLGRGAGG